MNLSQESQESDGGIWLFSVVAVIVAVLLVGYVIYLSIFGYDTSSRSSKRSESPASIASTNTPSSEASPSLASTTSEPSLYAWEDGYAWNRASDKRKIGLCVKMAKISSDIGEEVSADFLFVELEEFYNSSESEHLRERISDIAALVIKAAN